MKSVLYDFKLLKTILDEKNRGKIYSEGKWKTTTVHDYIKYPFTGEKTFEFYIANSDETGKAIDTAKKTLLKMKRLTSWDKSQVLKKVSELIYKYKDELAKILVIETGKPLKDAIGEIQRTINTFNLSANAALNLKGEIISTDITPHTDKRYCFTKKEPLGVIGAITGFNFPLLLAAHKLGPAFASGNTVILKPSPKTPITSLILAHLFEKAGLPKGALSVLNGFDEVGKEITESKDVPVISFTGSSNIGKKISEQAIYKKVLLELGSNAATVIDSIERNEMDKIANKIVKGGMSTVGQSCISVQRVLIHEDYIDEFNLLIVEKIKKLKVGNPLNEDTDVSTVYDEQSQERIISWIKQGEELGAKKLVGDVSGRIITPTLVTNVTPQMKLFKNEIFGPVIVTCSFSNINEAVNLVNNSDYGLQAGLFSSDIKNIKYFIDNVEVGGIHINEVSNYRPDNIPYGGVKDSGIGKEGPEYLIDEFTYSKVVSLNI